MSVDTLPGVLLISEAAKHARVSKNTIYRHIAAGKLRATRIGGAVRVTDEDLAAWLRSCAA